MKEILINVLISCDWWNCGVKSSKDFSPSSSIEEIADYLCAYLNLKGHDITEERRGLL